MATTSAVPTIAARESVMTESRERRVDGVFLWRIFRRNGICLVLAGLLLGCAAGFLCFFVRRPSYTVEVGFLLRTTRVEQTADGENVSIALDATDTAGAADAAQTLMALLREAYAKDTLIAEMGQNAVHGEALEDMLSLTAEGPVLRVTVTGKERETVVALARAVEYTVPDVTAHYLGVDTDCAPGSTGCRAEALSRICEGQEAAFLVQDRADWRISALVGFFGGVVIAYVVLFVWTLCEDTVRSAEDLRRCYRAPVIGAVFATTDGRTSKVRGEKKAVGDTSARSDREIERLAILLRGGEGSPCRVMGFTSDCRRAGVTATVAHTAEVLARMNRRVLVVDGNLKHPTLHTFFDGTAKGSGLADVLESLASGGRVGWPTGNSDRPTVMAGERASHRSAELLSSADLSELLRLARNRFDVILLDLPGLGESVDAAIPAEEMDGYILVARCGRSHTETLDASCEILERAGASVWGFVLTAASKP